jgi:RimJ/RimL family protein N-acetyltransferase
VSLRPLQAADAEMTVVWRNDPAVRDQVLSFRFPVTHQMEARFIERAIAGDGIDQCVAAIVDRADGALCGMVYLHDIDWISRHAKFGIMIGRQDRQGRGLGTHAMRLMLGHGFRVLNLERIYLYVADYNDAQHLYERYGFVHEGRLRRHVALDGRYHDLLVMGLLRDEYEAIEQRLAAEGT